MGHTTSKTLLESIRTMIARLAVFGVILVIALAQSSPPKPPCPGSPECPRYRKAARSGKKLNWVWCDNKPGWNLLNEEQCKAPVIDPTLEVCNNPSNGDFFKEFPNTGIWVWKNPPPSDDLPFHRCAHMNFCFCKFCGEETS